jgi:hypothetical protein
VRGGASEEALMFTEDDIAACCLRARRIRSVAFGQKR